MSESVGSGGIVGPTVGGGGATVGGVIQAGRPSRAWKGIKVLLVLALVVGAGVAAINFWMIRDTRPDITTLARAPHAQAAIVLGARVYPDHQMSPMLRDRVQEALLLYRAGKVNKIIVSGDHGSWAYDEPGTMRDFLVAAGVPPQNVFTDHAGFDTWATMKRAKLVFGVDTAIVVTQDFHMPRALFLAHAAGLQADGVTSDLHDYGFSELTSQRREVMARVKALRSAEFDSKVLLGPSIPIAGDGRASWGPKGPA